ncbi:MAG TPA: lipopolysaccharide heptosyltransferase II [Gammaproteobacteria bacterium]|nr:lipopolysaccharide heptosyltransferase II [Gammaproteobacteria bacterium]
MSEQRILIAAPNWIGDFVIADTLFRLLKQREPRTAIDVLAPAWALPLAERMTTVAQAIELPGGHGELALAARLRLARRLRTVSYVRAYVLPRSAKSALVPWLGRVPLRTGYRGEYRYGLLNDLRQLNPAHESLARRYAALAFAADAELPAELPPPVLASSAATRAAAMSRLGLAPGAAPVVALAPGAEYGPAKRWPIEAYAALAARFAAAGWQSWLLGSAGERLLAESVAARVPMARNLAGETTLVEAVDVLGASTVAVTNDSGLMHMAAALGIPQVALFGSSSPRYTPPANPRARILYRGLPCSPCFARECPLGHRNCLRAIGVEEVYLAAREQARLAVAD